MILVAWSGQPGHTVSASPDKTADLESWGLPAACPKALSVNNLPNANHAERSSYDLYLEKFPSYLRTIPKEHMNAARR